MRSPNKLADSFPAALGASLLLQAGAAGFLAGYGAVGSALVALGLAILISRLKAVGILSNERLLGMAIVVLLVSTVFEAFNLYIRAHQGGFPSVYAPEKSASSVGSGQYKGVILWTDAKPATIFVPPRPQEHKPGIAKRQQLLTIPFDGVYWFFKFPDHRPPKDSYTTLGSPSATSFRSSDWGTLQMEAHQTFITPVDMNCCSRIGVEILNAEHTSETILVELVLTNSSLPGEPSQSLGRQPVPPNPPFGTKSSFQSPTEVLNFVLPQDPRIQQFDAATVRFIRNGRLGWSSVRIAVQEFTLVPRGL